MADRQTGLTAPQIALADGPPVGDFVALLKPRVMSLVVFTAVTGLVLAPGDMHPVLAVIAVLCIAVGAGAAGAVNMWYERDVDALMTRTRARPLPAGRMNPGTALGFGVMLSVGSVSVMALAANWTAAALLSLTIAFYVFVYTIWLKRRTPQNIVIGGAAGAVPPMIGWAAVTGDIGLGGIALFALIFMWTPPHFWALSLYKCGDYQEAGIPMMPVVAGTRETKRQILLYTLLLVPVSLSPSVLGIAGPVYAGIAAAMGLVFIGLAWQVWRAADEARAPRLFGFSILYLFVLFATMLAERLLAGVF